MIKTVIHAVTQVVTVMIQHCTLLFVLFFLSRYNYFFVALFMTIKVDVNSRTYFIVVPRLRSRFSTLADFEASLGNKDTVFSKAQKYFTV